MLKVKNRKNDLVITMPRKFIKSDFVQAFLDRLDAEMISQKSKLSDKDACKSSEEIKASWWQKNKSSILDRISD